MQTSVFRLATFLPYKLGVVTDAVSRVFADHYLNSFNLTISEWRALAVIAEHETLSPTAVGQLTAMDKVKVSRATHSLVSKGMLRQTRDPGDGRGRLLRLTRKGNTTYIGMVTLADDLQSTVFSALSRPEISTLDRILSKVMRHLAAAEGADSATGPVDWDSRAVELPLNSISGALRVPASRVLEPGQRLR